MIDASHTVFSIMLLLDCVLGTIVVADVLNRYLDPYIRRGDAEV